MSRLTLSALLAAILVSYHAVYASYSSPSAIYPREGNSTSALLNSANFTFPIPSDPRDPHFADSFANWVGVVCLSPDVMTLDQCYLNGTDIGINWGRCPNGDVSGILVRVSTYLANLLLGIIAIFDDFVPVLERIYSGGIVYAQLAVVSQYPGL
ncbi:hypothetical protein B0H19DRAFT_1065520 [Mycena capillaripes]|nr:hypothetical protein B0H19DRAFT_1065520 [Mycena capillaripes]